MKKQYQVLLHCTYEPSWQMVSHMLVVVHCKTTDQLQEYNAIIYYVDVRNIPVQVTAIVVKDSYSYCSSLGSESLCS